MSKVPVRLRVKSLEKIRSQLSEVGEGLSLSGRVNKEDVNVDLNSNNNVFPSDRPSSDVNVVFSNLDDGVGFSTTVVGDPGECNSLEFEVDMEANRQVNQHKVYTRRKGDHSYRKADHTYLISDHSNRIEDYSDKNHSYGSDDHCYASYQLNLENEERYQDAYMLPEKERCQDEHMLPENDLNAQTNARQIKIKIQCLPESPEISAIEGPSAEKLLQFANLRLAKFLPRTWVSFVSDGGIHVMLFSRTKVPKVVQRQLLFSLNGNIDFSVHSVELPILNYVENIPSPVRLTPTNLDCFVDRCIKIVNSIRGYEICTGFPGKEFKSVWKDIPNAQIDGNCEKEDRYKECLRSLDCELLVSLRRWRCRQCDKLRFSLRRRLAAFRKKEAHPHTPNSALSDNQKSVKLENQKKSVDALKRKLERMESKMKQLLEAQGLDMSEEESDDPMDLDLTEVQS